MSGIAFALILSFILFRLITKPVNEITLKMNEFAKCNLSARVKIDNSNEIGIFANGFNRMADEIEKKSFSLQLLQFIVEHSSDAFYIIREDASFEFVNGSASRDLGYSKEEFSNFRLYDIDRNFTPDIWEKNWENLKSIKEKTFETTQ